MAALKQGLRGDVAKTAVALSVAALAAYAIAYVDQGAYDNPTRVPLVVALQGDGLFYQATVFKTIADTHHLGATPFLGAPWGMNVLDFPLLDSLIYGYCELAGLFTSDWIPIYNFALLASYAMSAAWGTAAAVAVGVRRMAAVSIGLLFAFSCYHHHRLWGHINLGMFCGVVAGAVAIALQLVRLEPLGFRAHGHWRVTVDRPLRSWVFFVFAIATGLSGTGYYAYLSLWLFLFATLVAFARSPSVAVLVRGAVYGACTFAAFLFTALPTLFRAHEASGLPVGRPRIDVEVFALKLAHLLLPMPGHRIAYFARQREIYEAANPIPSEASVAALGIVGTVAFVWTVCAVLAPTPRKGRSDTRDLGILNLWMFLLATMGGIASLVAVVGFTQFRSYNRVSIYIHFASLLAIGLAWSRGTWVFKHGRVALALLVLVVGASTWETTYPGPSAGNRRDAADFYLTRQHFFDDVEAHFRGGAMLQLPVVSCPESPRVEGLAPFAELEPYLHTKTLRFSACTMRTRPEDVRLHTLGGQTPHEMVTSARDTGYSAIFLHRLGYEHDGASMHGALTAELGPPVFTLPVDHLEVFDLGARTGAAAGSAM